MATSISYNRFEELFEIPLRNGFFPPKESRGSGICIIKMGDLFSQPRIYDSRELEKVRLPKSEEEKYLLKPGDLLFARTSLNLDGAGKCSIFKGLAEPAIFESNLIRARLNRTTADPVFFYYFFQSSLGHQLIERIVEQVTAASIRSRLRRNCS